MRDRVRIADNIWLWGIVLLGGALRFYRLEFQSLWYDEGLQYFVASNNTLGQLFSETHSFHPPLSFVVNYVFLQIQQSELFLRLPSALFGIASLPLFYSLAQEVSSKRVALYGTFVLAISPFHIWYSQEGRMYSQLLFFSLLSTVMLLRALKYSGWWWVSYIVVSAAGIYTHVFMVLALVGQFLWVLIYHRDRWVSHAAGGVVIFVGFLPWVVFIPWVQRFFRGLTEHGLHSQAPTGSNAAFRATGFSWESLPYTFFTYSSGFSLGPTVAELHDNRSAEFLLQFIPVIVAVGVVFGALLIIGLYGLYRLFGARAAWLCILGIAIPVLGSLLYALAPRAAYNVRYTIVGFPYFCLFVGAGLAIACERQRAIGIALCVGVVGVSLTSLNNHFFNPRYAKEDIRSAVAVWRLKSTSEPLLSVRSHYVLAAYLTPPEKRRHSVLGGNVTTDIDLALTRSETGSIYILLARDWGKLREKEIKEAYEVNQEEAFPGVKLLRVSRVRETANSAGAL